MQSPRNSKSLIKTGTFGESTVYDDMEKGMGDLEMSLIKVGLEASREQLRIELLSHPCRYFFILMIDNRAVLCIQTCNSIGENLQSHVVDSLVPDSSGNLVSVFEEELHLAIKDWRRPNGVSYGEELHSISPAIAEKIEFLPGFIDWIISTVLTKDRNILIYPASWS